MKKDLFNSKIKREYLAYIWFTIIFFAFIFIVAGSCLLYSALQHESGSVNRIVFLIFSVLFYLWGIFSFSLTIFVIRKYPKYPKLRRFCLNSDCYFVDCDSKEFHGHKRGKQTFSLITFYVEQNKDLENIKYPKKYKVYIGLTVISIVFLFINLFGMYFLMKRIPLLPTVLQNEGVIFAVFAIVEILDMVLSFMFAFRVKKIRKETIDTYKKKKKIEERQQ